ncbi:MAG: hypothetical protein IJ868_04535 [Prevotella sp.]|nr:hypothetical protein [Prevotella sp.]
MGSTADLLSSYNLEVLIQALQDIIIVLAIIVMPFVLIRVLLPDMKLLANFANAKYGGTVKQRLTGEFEYHHYYLTENSLKQEKNAREFAAILHTGYVDSWFGDYYCNLSEEHLPLNIFVNWTRTIVEDLLSSVNPINHVCGWDNYLRNTDSFNPLLRKGDIYFENYEIAYLWGGVYYWLHCLTPGFNNEGLLRQIEEVACRKKYLSPYFLLFKNMANGIEFEHSMTFMPLEKASQTRPITSEQTALLWLAIAKLSEGEVKNKKNLAPVIHNLTGVGEKSLALKIVGAFKDEDKKALTDIVEEQMPNLADKILHIEKSNPLP